MEEKNIPHNKNIELMFQDYLEINTDKIRKKIIKFYKKWLKKNNFDIEKLENYVDCAWVSIDWFAESIINYKIKE